jgi:hypothetical protein
MQSIKEEHKSKLTINSIRGLLKAKTYNAIGSREQRVDYFAKQGSEPFGVLFNIFTERVVVLK